MFFYIPGCKHVYFCLFFYFFLAWCMWFTALLYCLIFLDRRLLVGHGWHITYQSNILYLFYGLITTPEPSTSYPRYKGRNCRSVIPSSNHRMQTVENDRMTNMPIKLLLAHFCTFCVINLLASLILKWLRKSRQSLTFTNNFYNTRQGMERHWLTREWLESGMQFITLVWCHSVAI